MLRFKVVTHYPNIGLRYLQTNCVSAIYSLSHVCLSVSRNCWSQEMSLLLTQVVFDKVVSRVVTTADTVLPTEVVNWGWGGRGGKMYWTLLTQRLLNTNYQFHITLLLVLRNGPRYPLDSWLDLGISLDTVLKKVSPVPSTNPKQKLYPIFRVIRPVWNNCKFISHF
jgi:hypothetical protein